MRISDWSSDVCSSDLRNIEDIRSKPYGIGDLSGRTGVNIETIRYYERIGIMPEPPRSAGRQRVYDSGHIKRLAFIRRSRELGFSLDEVRALLTLVDGGDYTCGEVQDRKSTRLNSSH